jgi:2-keto-4-pentenoate hydratase/2-oxohepta-3-ene-1,7-dioic acid hydratase in catechol pathway
MKLLTFTPHQESSGPPRVGALLRDANTVVDLQAASQRRAGKPSPHFHEMLAFLDGGDAARQEAEELLQYAAQQQPLGAVHSLDSLDLHAPVPCPRSIRDCMAFEQHLIRAMRTVLKWRCRPIAAVDSWLERRLGRGLLRVPAVWFERPIYYKGNPHSVVGHGAEVDWPAFTERLDYELEFGIFIGRKGRDIPIDDAHKFVAGYTIFNDFSARDIQLREMQGRLGPAKSKDFDTGNAIGPYLITPDEVPDPYDLTLRARVNGQLWSEGKSAEMHFTFEQMIAAISENETLYPGDFIGSGTVPGGCGLELDRWLAPDDVVELEVDRLGVLRNRIARRPRTLARP